MRNRACVAVFDATGERLLMVRLRFSGRDSWSLPGGQQEDRETLAKAFHVHTPELAYATQRPRGLFEAVLPVPGEVIYEDEFQIGVTDSRHEGPDLASEAL